MGFLFRRSASFGPFRLNFSKSGVGAAFGVKGARLTMTPTGTTYITVGSHGFYYREVISTSAKHPRSSSPHAEASTSTIEDGIGTADPLALVDSSNQVLIDRLNHRARMGNPAGFLYAVGSAVLLASICLFATGTNRLLALGLLSGAIVLFVTGAFLHRNNRHRRITRLVYELDEIGRQNQSVLEQSFSHLARSQAIWRMLAESQTYDWKRNAGASSLVRRTRVAVRSSTPPRVETNVSVSCIDLGESKLYFLPDMALYWQTGAFGGIGYEDLSLEYRPTRFIEDEHVPSDAYQIDETWRYVRKDGGPDLRFNNNRRIPVMQYGAVALRSSKGLNILLNVSSVETAAAFVNCLLEYKTRRERRLRSLPSNLTQELPASHKHALKVLGLQPDASPENISEAYRKLAQMYHPDKVAGLAPEFHEIAERRMKEINAAYHLLKNSHKTS